MTDLAALLTLGAILSLTAGLCAGVLWELTGPWLSDILFNRIPSEEE